MQRSIDIADPCRDCGRFADAAHIRLVRTQATIEQRLAAAAETFEAVLAMTARSLDLRAKSLDLLDRPIYRPLLIARPVEPTTGKRPPHRDGRR